MVTGLLRYGMESQQQENSTTSPSLTVGGCGPQGPVVVQPSAAGRSVASWRTSQVLGSFLLAFNTLTNPRIVFTPADPSVWLGSCAVEIAPRRRRISLRQARWLALAFLHGTERRLREERAAEAMFLVASWESASDDLRDAGS
jgi:hypothetical protein